MKTMFSAAPFGKFELGWSALGQMPRAPQAVFGTFTDILSKIGISEEEINALLAKVPSELLGTYQKKLDECKAKGVTTAEGAACLYALYQEIKQAGEKKPEPTAPATAAPPKAAPSEFPWIPVGIAALVVGGIVVYFAARG